MMRKLTAMCYKELLLLVRDRSGLAILFLMPLALVIVMTLIQDVTFRKISEKVIPVIVINHDKGSFGTTLIRGLKDSGNFEVMESFSGDTIDEETMNRLIAEGRFQVGLIIPGDASEVLKEQTTALNRFMFSGNAPSDTLGNLSSLELIFDPVVQDAVRLIIRNTLENLITKAQARTVFQNITQQVSPMRSNDLGDAFDRFKPVGIRETFASKQEFDVVPDSVQHNIPGWTIFAMFFIVIPLTGNIIKERQSGIRTRLRIMPASNALHLSGKIIIYLMVCMIQFVLMILTGIYIMPLFGLAALELGYQAWLLIPMSVSIALAATGYGIMLAYIATTHEQAASFGTVSVIIMAALGGIWVPTFVMPELMRQISRFSPLNWGLEGFYDIILRGGSFSDIIPEIAILLLFFLITFTAGLRFAGRNRN